MKVRSLACLFALLACAAVPEAPRERPNVLFLIADDLTASALASYGNAQCATPNLDRLAARGVRFTRAYCQFPVCGPSRAALMSGMYAQSIGVTGNGKSERFTANLGERPSLAEHFRDHGYYTARVGKIYHMRVPGDVTAGVDGPDHAESWIERFNCQGPEWATRGEHEHLSNETLKRIPDKHYGLGFGTAFYAIRAAADAARQPDALAADKAIELLEAHRDEPFFLAVGFVRPHVPLVAPAEFYAPYPAAEMELAPAVDGDWDDIPKAGISGYNSKKRGLEDPERQRKVLSAYYASVSFLDAQVGRVLDALDELGLADDTLVVFTSDHGYHLGEHDFWQKMSLHEESARIPLMMAGPGIEPAESGSLVEQIDFYPTLAALAGLDVPAHCQGESLVPVLADPRHRVRDGAYTLKGRGHLWRTDHWAYMEYPGGEVELYDMVADPRQFTNLAQHPEHAATVERLAGELGAKLASLKPRPNVIVLITDDQGYGDLGAHGNGMISTEHLDRLWAESVRLTDFHVDPTCSPTRAALMSGRYSTRTGVWHTIMGRSLMDPEEETLAELFRANGYRTGMFGKWHLGDNWPLRPQDQGFEHVVWHRGGGVGQGPDYWGNSYFDDTYEVNGEWRAFEGYCTDVWFEEARRFIESGDGRPFFAYLSTNAPHGPFLVSDEYAQPYRDFGVPETMARFYGMITNIDENVGRLRAWLAEEGLADNTVFVFLTDNGTARGHSPRGEEGHWPGFRAGMRGAKGSEYEGGHRVPCFVHWPDGGVAGGRDVDALAAHVDLWPTLAELCGLDASPPRPLDGASFASALRGDGPPPDDRTLFVHSQRIELPKKWRKSTVMTEDWRLVNGEELYDLDADPAQERDVAAEHPERVAELRARYESWWASLAPVFDDYVRIGLGGNENPVELMSHDWHTRDRGVPWHQDHVRDGYVVNGPWAVDVARAGEYEITLRRWPAQLKRAMDAVHASVAIGGESASVEVDASATRASFRLRLPPGPTELLTTLRRPDGTETGAYFASVRFLGE